MKPAILLQMLLETPEEESGILLMTKNIHLQILKNNISCNICTLTSEGEAQKFSVVWRRNIRLALFREFFYLK